MEKKERKIATVLGLSILFAVLIFAVYFVMKGFKAYADTLIDYESSVISESNADTSTCATCNQ